jgi:protein-L-isoaspartate(D-aspartate) O-methyltransferase
VSTLSETDDNAATASTQADPLRERLVAELREHGQIRTDQVARAFRAVPRHLFAPDVPLDEAYANDVVRTKRNEHGVTISSISAPWLQAMMLEQAELQPGMRCLEIGSGGYNAALMAELVGPSGQVTTVDIDPDVTDRARRCLPDAGYGHVNVVLADAEDGVPENAPYDRIVVTVGVWDLPPAWTGQLTERGRIVVPLRMRGLSRSVAFDREGDHLASRGHEMAGFVAVQGAGAHQETLVLLHGEDVGIRFDESQAVDAGGLRDALLQPRVEAWTGVRFGGMEPFDGLFLWLATCMPDFCLLSRQPTDTARRLADPASPIGTPTHVDGNSFAYLTYRKTDQDTYEFGAYAHGPDAEKLAEQMSEQIRVWDRDHRHGSAAQITVYPAGTPDEQLPGGRVLRKRHTKVTLSWP